MPGPTALTTLPEPSPPDEGAGTRAPTETVTEDHVLDAVRTILTEVIGEDDLLGLDIELDTSFDEDLEIESIEFVALSEALTDRYGDAVDFVAWMATMELDEIIGLTVGRLVSFIATSVNDHAASQD